MYSQMVLKKEADIDNDDTIKKGRGRPTKKDLYPKERQEILDKLYKILNIDSTTEKFYLCDIESDPKKIDDILSLKDDVGTYFTCRQSSVFYKPLEKNRKPHTSLIRAIFKGMDKKITISNTTFHRNGTIVRTLVYNIH